ncbi:MAG TPA: sugar ABC transporter permease YjfF [Anaeromyxobacter sp.]|nr:sugar ABC transporter permease YjfF [Anaeromyxobacter sp.]
MTLPLNRKYLPLVATSVVFLVVFVAAGVMYEGFITLNNFANLLTRGSFVGLCAVGMTFVIIAGGIDLSVGSMVAFSSTVLAWLTEIQGVPAPIAVVLVLALGTLFGLAQGAMIHFYKAPAFIVTLAGMFLLRGLAFVVAPNQAALGVANPTLVKLAEFELPIGFDANLRFGALALVAAVIVAALVLGRTRFGRNVYAVGGSEQSVLLMGLPLARTKLGIYAISGFCAALAGLTLVIETQSGNPSEAVGFELEAIAAVVIGGTLLTGGYGFVAGTLVGVLIRQVIYTIIEYNGRLTVDWAMIVIGALLLVFILLQRFFSQGTAAGRATARRRTAPPPRLAPVPPPAPPARSPARIGADDP